MIEKLTERVKEAYDAEYGEGAFDKQVAEGRGLLDLEVEKDKKDGTIT